MRNFHVSGGLDITMQKLAVVRNEAASQLLVTGLDSPDPTIREKSLATLLRRRSPSGHAEVLRRWPKFESRSRSILLENAGRLQEALRNALVGKDSNLFSIACDCLLEFREYDLVPTLINAAESEGSSNSKRAAATILRLTELLYEELAGGDNARRRDPQLIRNSIVNSLEASVRKFSRHLHAEIVEAFLLLVNRDNSVLRELLHDPYAKIYLEITSRLTHSPRSGVMRLLLSFLEDATAPTSIVQVFGYRKDPTFVRHWLKKVGFEPSTTAKTHLKRIHSIAWLRDDYALLDSFDDAGQHASVQITIHSAIPQAEAFPVIRHLLLQGKPGGRRAAAKALATFRGAEANSLAISALNDADALVQAAIVPQLRDRNLPGALTRLIELIDSPHSPVRDAARGSLVEFTYRRFSASFDMLDDEVRRSTGRLVRKVDPQAIPALQAEMKAKARGRRLRSLMMVSAMQCAKDLEEDVLLLLKDEDHLVRAAAAQALSACSTEKTLIALREALLDRSVTVQQAAEESLLILSGQGTGKGDEQLELLNHLMQLARREGEVPIGPFGESESPHSPIEAWEKNPMDDLAEENRS